MTSSHAVGPQIATSRYEPKMPSTPRALPKIIVLATLLVSPGYGQPWPPAQNLDNIGPGEGLTLNGLDSADEAGDRVAGVGDLNHDGFDDVAVAAPDADPNGDLSGEVYIVFGSTTAGLAEIPLDELDGANGFRIDGVSPLDHLGGGLAGAGDVNGDGVDDLLVSAPYADPNGFSSGQVYVVFGRTSFPPVLDLESLDGTDGARIDGITLGDQAGASIAGAGDFNGDGIDDFIIGAENADLHGSSVGEAYLGFGRTIWPATLQLASLNGETGFRMTGIDSGDRAGTAVSRAGDVNGDGLSDVLVGAPFADPNGDASGEAYLVFGRLQQPAVVALEDLNGANGVTLNGVSEERATGFSVGDVGDLNGDGTDDLLIGAYGDAGGPSGGETYVVYGREIWDAVVELGSLGAAEGITINGIVSTDSSGWSVSGAGDFNGDGIDDALIGAPHADPNGTSSGESYVLFGGAGLPQTVELDSLDGSNGTVFEGTSTIDLSGSSVASIGDFNGDGMRDIVIGGPGGHSTNGFAHVVFGRFETGVTLGATAPSCPGTVQLRSNGLTPVGEIQLFRGSGRGASVVQGGACAGTELDLAEAQLIRTFSDVNDLGQWLRTVEIGNAHVCGTHIQAVDLTTCLVSNVTTLPTD